MAQCRTRVSRSTMQRGKADGANPHRTKTVKLLKDQEFATRTEDVTVALKQYRNPPKDAVILDKKSRSQARDRTQPGLPLKRRTLRTMTHE